MNTINIKPMTFLDYRDKMNHLFIKRYLLLIEIAQNGPIKEERVFYNPDDIDPVIEEYDLIETLEELDQQILETIAEFSKEEWFDKHKTTIRREESKLEAIERSRKIYSFGNFPF